MGLRLEYVEGQTPISEEEKEGLKIRAIVTQNDLNQFEQLHIEKAMIWLMRTSIKPNQILSVEFIKMVHKRMFGDIWTWAGTFRNTEKNIGVSWVKISEELSKLLSDTQFWIDNKTYPADEIAIRFKHRLVSIHCFSNGNGRHSRVMADIIIQHIFQKEIFTWSNSNLYESNKVRTEYINAIKLADQGNVLRLLGFARG